RRNRCGAWLRPHPYGRERAARDSRRTDAHRSESQGGCEMDDATGRVGRKRKTTGATGGTVAATGNETGDPTLPEETDARAREIREEIAQTREDMSETLDAIQDRLKPSTIVANA